jgi:hypothetical protein
MISRRALVWAAGGGLARPAAAALVVPAGGALAFSMVRRGSEIGRHTLRFESNGERLEVHVAIEARVTFFSVQLAHYRLRLIESWQGERLIWLDGRTDKNGQQNWVRASRTAEGLVVEGSGTARYVAPDDATPITYWNRHMLDGPMIDAESGELQRPRVVPRGEETIPLASGAKIAAEHYNLSNGVHADVWYDRTDTWAGLAFDLVDGSNLHYERL